MPYEVLEAENKPGYEVLEPEQPPAALAPNPRRDALLAKQKALREASPAGRMADAAYTAAESLTAHGLLSWPTRTWNYLTGSRYADPDTSKPIANLRGVTEDALKELETRAGYPGALAGPDSPALGVGQAVEDTATGLTSPEGLLMLPATATPAGRMVLAADMLRHVPGQIEESRDVVNDPHATVSDAARALTIPAIGVAGSAALGPRPTPLPQFISDPVELAAIKGATPSRRLGVRVGPNALEGAELQALAEQGMREAASPLVVPGQVPAVDLLRLQQQQIIQPGEAALLERPGGGEALGGKISFNAPAEAGGIPSARQTAIEGSKKGPEELPSDRIAEVSAEQMREVAKRGGRDLGDNQPEGMWIRIGGKEFLFINKDLPSARKAEVKAHELKHRDIQHAIENNDPRFNAAKDIVEHVLDNPDADPNLFNLIKALQKAYSGTTALAKELLADGWLKLEDAHADLADIKEGKHANQAGLIVKRMVEKKGTRSEAGRVTGPDALSYRRPTPAPTQEQAAAALLRANVERGLTMPEIPMEPVEPTIGQYPEGSLAGTLSRLQRSRIQAGKENVRSGVRNNPPGPRSESEPPSEPSGTPAPPQPPKPTPASGLESLTEGINFEQIQSPHKVGVERGLSLTEADVPGVGQLLAKAEAQMVDSFSRDTPEAKADFGRYTYLKGVMEGATRTGPNYEHFLRERAKASPEGATKELGAADIPPAVPTTKTAAEQIPADDIIAKLQKWKYEEDAQGRIVDPQGKLFTLPHPDAIKAIGKGVWNNAIDVAIAAIKTGRAVSEAVDIAVKYIRHNVKSFDETQLRNNLNSVFANEKITGPKSYPVQGENVEMRKSAARAKDSDSFPEPVRETIAKAPESFYQQQSTAQVSKLVGAMPDMELASVPKNSDLYVAAALERAKRLFNAGKNDEGYGVFVELEKEGTRLGQLINQFKMLDGASPTSVATIVDKGLHKAGRDLLTPDQRDRLIGMSQQSIELTRALDAAKDNWLKDPTPENAAKADAALEAANKADLNVQTMVNRFTPKTIPGTLKSILQGNLLTPISEVANIVGNLSFLPFRALDRSAAASLDVLDSYLRNKAREIHVSPVRGTIEAAKGAARGATQIPGILLRGAGETIKGEKATGLQPLRAWVDQFAKNPDLPTQGGKLPFSERVRLAIEGTFGIPAAAMLRGLQAGDQPFRQAAQARIIANEAKRIGLSGERLAMAQKFPELFFDRAALKRIQEDTLYAIFQRNSKSLNYISNLMSSRGPWVDLAAATVAPYKLTPWNIVSEILSYNPLVATARTAYEAKQGNSRAAKLNAGKFVVGSMLTAAGYWLYNKGLLAPSMDTPDEQQKARLLAGEVLPPNHINLSGLERALNGGDPAFKPGDKTADVFRAGGLAGSFFYMTANIGRDMEKQPKGDDAMYGSLLRNSTLEQARFGMNQSFLQGVGGLMQAVKSGETDNYVQSWANTALSIPLPNTLSTLSRATRPAKLEPAGLQGLLKPRLGVFGLGDMLPIKRGLWGEPIPETPEGRNAIIYHFFDITKEKDVTDDPVAIELYRLWRKTADTTVIPTPPEKSVTIGKTAYNLTSEQHSRYAELVGKNRRFIVDTLLNNPAWAKSSDEDKIKVLQQAYTAGAQYGKEQFWREFQGKLAPKPERAGFTASPR